MAGPTVERARVIQFGKESTNGTPVAATWKYPGILTFDEEHDFYEPPYPQGVRGMVSGQLVEQRAGLLATYASEATYEEIANFAAMCLKGAVSPSMATLAYTYVFTPPVSGDPVPNAHTLEFATNDWTTKYGRQASFVLCDKLTLQGSQNKPLMLTASLFGRKPTSGTTPTAALTIMTGREVAAGNLTKLYMDPSGANLGMTQVSGSLLDWSVEWNGGLRPDYTQDGRSSLDFTQYTFGDVVVRVTLTVEYIGAIDTEIGNWRSKTTRFVRLKTTGSTVSAAVKTIQQDVACEYVKKPVKIGTRNGNDIVTLVLESKYDATWAKIANLTIINALATYT